MYIYSRPHIILFSIGGWTTVSLRSAVALEVAPIAVLSYHHVPSVLWTYCPTTTSPMALMPYRHQSYHKSVLLPTVLSLFCPIATSPIALLHYRRQSHRQIRYQAYRYYCLLPVSVLSDGPVIKDIVCSIICVVTSPIALLAYHRWPIVTTPTLG